MTNIWYVSGDVSSSILIKSRNTTMPVRALGPYIISSQYVVHTVYAILR